MRWKKEKSASSLPFVAAAASGSPPPLSLSSPRPLLSHSLSRVPAEAAEPRNGGLFRSGLLSGGGGAVAAAGRGGALRGGGRGGHG